MRDPTKMSFDTERTLEWLHLLLATFCATVSVLLRPVSSHPSSGDSTLVGGAEGLVVLVGLPLLLVTSAILLFTNRVRAIVGFAALLLSILAHSTA